MNGYSVCPGFKEFLREFWSIENILLGLQSVWYFRSLRGISCVLVCLSSEVVNFPQLLGAVARRRMAGRVLFVPNPYFVSSEI